MRKTLYSVWDNRNDELVAFELPAAKCAEIMGVKVTTIYKFLSPSRKSGCQGKRWHVEKREVDEK